MTNKDNIKVVNNNTERITDMPKIKSPFKRKENNNGDYVVYNEIEDGYTWVFKNPDVQAIEKLHGTNVSVIIENGNITAVYNRTNRVPPYHENKDYITKGIINSKKRGWLNLRDGQWFGELVGPKLHKNPYELDKHYWVPFQRYAQKHLEYKSWGKYDKDFESISRWFQNTLFSLFYSKIHGTSLDEASVQNGTFCEGIMFTDPETGKMAKLRRDMFDWFEGSPRSNH